MLEIKGKVTTAICYANVIEDEAPMAYKSLTDIIDVIRDSVDIIDIMKPVYNFKAAEGELPWKKKGNTNEKKDTDSAS